jgi:hypothetical protein
MELLTRRKFNEEENRVSLSLFCVRRLDAGMGGGREWQMDRPGSGT